MILKIYLSDTKINEFLEEDGYKVKTILMIIKESLDFKNSIEIINNTNFSKTFLNTKLCWKTDLEKCEIIQNINRLVSYFSSENRRCYFYGKRLLYFVIRKGSLCYRTGTEKSLLYFTTEETIKRWIKEKF